MNDEQGMFVAQVTRVMPTAEIKLLKTPRGSSLNLVGSASEQSVTIIMFPPHPGITYGPAMWDYKKGLLYPKVGGVRAALIVSGVEELALLPL